MKPVAYAYVRYSSLAQASGGSIERQTDSLKEFTERTGVEVKEVIRDEGVSSFKGRNVNKGQFKQILDRIQSGLIRKGDYIVVESIDRITRQRVIDGVQLLQGILRDGIRIYTTSDRICYSLEEEGDDFNTLMMIALIAKRANEESAIKSWRGKKEWSRAKALAASGVRKINRNNYPYGLEYDSSLEKFVVKESEAKEIRRIFELLKYMGVANTIKEVNKDSKRKWANRHVAHMISSQYPLGVLRSQKRNSEGKKEFVEYIEGYYPEIVSQKDFNEAIAAMKGRRDRKDYGSRASDEINIFRGAVKCAKCGASLLFEKQRNQKGVPYFYFHCYSRKELRGGCDQRFRFDLAFGMLLLFMKFTLNNDEPVGYRKFSSSSSLYKEYSPAKLPVSSERAFIMRRIPVTEEMRRHRQSYISAVADTKSELVGLFSGPTPSDIQTVEELSRAQNELQKARGEYERYERSIDQYGGDVPQLMIKKLKEVEDRIAKKIDEVEGLSRKVDAAKFDIPIHGVRDVINMYKTKAGRLELNRFLIAKKIKFEFRYESALRRLDMTVYRDGVKLLELPSSFPLHSPLKIFGLPNLAEFCEV